MAPEMTFQKLALICLMSTQVLSTSAFRMALATTNMLDVLQPRSSTCANSTFSSCSLVDGRLPANMCCPTDTTCISLDNGSSALCCPGTGSNCTQIIPTSCKTSDENADSNPNAQVFTTRLNDTLASCGTQCCPFGYTCNTNINTCFLDTSTSSEAPGFVNPGIPSSSTSSSPTSSSSTTKPTDTTAVIPTPVTSSNGSRTSGIDSSTPQSSELCTKFPGAAVAVGFFPGMFFGALAALVLILLCGRQRKDDSRPSSESALESKPHFRAHDISAPIPMDIQSTRSDFIRRTTTRARSLLRSPRFPGNKTPHMEGNWKMPTPPEENNIPAEPASNLIPVTPERQVRDERGIPKEPSTESIKVYSPPSMVSSRPVAPLRGMSTQRGAPTDSAIGSPFKTPPGRDNTYHDATTLTHNEILSPARYDDGMHRASPDQKASDMSRPTTTFTEMLRGIDFPDPLGNGKGHDIPPNMPPIPRGLDVKGKGRMQS